MTRKIKNVFVLELKCCAAVELVAQFFFKNEKKKEINIYITQKYFIRVI
jgi:hypothetical protein